MELGLKGKVAAVTGASRGLGLAIARGLAAEGCRLSICARGEDRLATAAAELSSTSADVMTQVVDVTAQGQVERFIDSTAERYGGLDIVVHNAGGASGGAALDTPDDAYLQGFGINVMPALRAARAARPHMRRRGGGRIVFIASVYGRESGGRASYNVAKAAEIALARALGRELAPEGILVNAVAPGSLMFPGSSWERRQKEDPQGIAAFVKTDLPMGRFGKPEEVASVVVFLCSQQASLVTGACWTVDGGQSRSLI